MHEPSTTPAEAASSARSDPIAPTPEPSSFSVAWYVVRFLLLLAAFQALFLAYLSEHAAFAAYLRGYASLSGWLLGLFGEEVVVHGQVMVGSGAGIEVRRGCDAFQPIALYCANVLAFPAPWRRRLTGLLVGVLALLVLNVARILSLYWLDEVGSPWFQTAHVTLWPVGFIVVSLLAWMVWARWAGKR